MSKAIHDFFTSELKLFDSNNIAITVSSDNAKPLAAFDCNNRNKARPNLKRSTRSAHLTSVSNKKDYRWGETPSPCSPGHAVSPLADYTCSTQGGSSSSTRITCCAESHLHQSRSISSLRAPSDNNWKSKKPPKYMCGKKEADKRRRDDSSSTLTACASPRIMDDLHQSRNTPSLPDPPSDINWMRSPKKHMEGEKKKEADNKHVINHFQQLVGNETATEIQRKGATKEPPQQPQRRTSIISMAA
jgi:hypothetical protein